MEEGGSGPEAAAEVGCRRALAMRVDRCPFENTKFACLGCLVANMIGSLKLNLFKKWFRTIGLSFENDNKTYF